MARLLAAGHDPTATDPQGRTPYQLAGSKEVRDAMRRYMADHLEQWDWAAAQVPSALTADMEAAQQSKKVCKCVEWWVTGAGAGDRGMDV